jgi:hypothetical protein
MSTFFRLFLTGVGLMLISSGAGALTLTLDDCDAFGCQGSDVFLTVLDNGNGTWDVTLGLDSTGYTGSLDGVVQAGFKAIDGATDVTLDSFSSGSWSDANTSFAGVSSSGLCTGPSSSDFVCSSGFSNILTNDVYTWNYTVTGGTLLDEWTIKFQYCDAGDTNCRGNLISAPGTPGEPVPEPSAALVFAAGLLAAAPRLRRRR